MRILFILVALFLGACAPSTTSQSDPPQDESTNADASVRDAQACTTQGGTWRRVCMMGKWACVIPYADGGKPCSDKKECTGQCRYEGSSPPAPGALAKGVCQLSSDPCGCFTEIRDGKIAGAMCVD